MFLKKMSAITILITTFVLTGAGCINFSGQSQGVVGMYRSIDKGEKWTATTAFPTVEGVKNLSTLKVYVVERDPSDPQTLYVGSRGQGMYFSYNHGDSWQLVSAMANKFIYDIKVDPKDKCNIFTTDGQHIYKSTDCARNWELVFTEERTNQRLVGLTIDGNNSKVIYGAQLNGDIIRSSDGGTSWRVVKRIGARLSSIESQVYSKDKTRIYVASYEAGLYRSDDNGSTWISLKKSFDKYSQSLKFFRLVLHPTDNDGVYWVSKYGILQSADAGNTWKEINLLTPPGSVDIYSFAVNPQNPNEIYYTGTLLNAKNENIRSTFYKSSDNGGNWVTRKLPTNTVPVFMSVYPKGGSILTMGFTVVDNK